MSEYAQNLPAGELHVPTTEIQELTDAFTTITLLNPKFHNFLNLPRELRNLIYEEYIKAEHLFYDWSWLTLENGSERSVFFPRWAPNILGTSHQVRSEFAQTFFPRAGYIEIESSHEAQFFAAFLDTLKLDKPFEVVRLLVLPHFDNIKDSSTHGGNAYMQLVMRCTALQKLRITFHASALRRRYLAKRQLGRCRFAMMLDEVLDFFQLRATLYCTALRCIELEGILPSEERTSDGFDPLQPLRQAGSWMSSEFRKQGQEVKVTLVKRVALPRV